LAKERKASALLRRTAGLKEAAQAKAKLDEKRVGIYSSQYEWGLVMGNQRGPTKLPVWFADYDGRLCPASASSEAGRRRDAKMSDCDVDLNWY